MGLYKQSLIIIFLLFTLPVLSQDNLKINIKDYPMHYDLISTSNVKDKSGSIIPLYRVYFLDDKNRRLFYVLMNEPDDNIQMGRVYKSPKIKQLALRVKQVEAQFIDMSRLFIKVKVKIK